MHALTLGPVVVDIAGLTLSDEDKTLLTNPWVGGIILFTRNYQSLEQLAQLIAEIRALRPELVVCVDQEGGRVQRFKAGFTRLPPMQDIGRIYAEDQARGLALAHAVGLVMAAELRACGVDLSFAPVLDLDDEHCAVIANRSFSTDPDIMSLLAEALIDGMHAVHMPATGKHFPGHGAVRGDSHLETPYDARALDEILALDVSPYKYLCQRGKLDAVMPAHVVYSQVDSQPAGFSKFWIDDVLKARLGFEGVIFSDDLTMEGAGVIADMGERARAALEAGCTALLVCNQRPAQLAVIAALEASGWTMSSNMQRLKTPFIQFDRAQLNERADYQAALALMRTELPALFAEVEGASA